MSNPRIAKTVNLIIAGIGGQGINSLAKVLAECILRSGYHCQFTIHKGGAQSLGSVYVEFRISKDTLSVLGQGIPTGQLDSLIALEPWEALRHLPLAHSNTALWVESKAMPFFIERSKQQAIKSPQQQLNALPLTVHWKAYQEIAQQQSGTPKMANYYAGLDCLTSLSCAFTESPSPFKKTVFDSLFFSRIKKAQRK